MYAPGQEERSIPDEARTLRQARPLCAAPCVVLTEIDFEALDAAAVRRIFVGATRATMKLTLVVSEAAAKVLLERL